MKLTYRGIDYLSQTKDKQTTVIRPTPIDKCGANQNKNLDRLISIRPVYYTYRGVSYTKHLVSHTNKKFCSKSTDNKTIDCS